MFELLKGRVLARDVLLAEDRGKEARHALGTEQLATQ